MSSSQIFSKYNENDNISNEIDEGTLNETHKLYNKVNFEEIPNKLLYDKIDEYKVQIIGLNKKVKAYQKIINEQKNKIRLLETNIGKLEDENLNYNNIITIQNDIITKARNINISLYEHIKKK